MTNDQDAPAPGTPDPRDWTFVLTEPCPECGFDPGYDSADTAARLRKAVTDWRQALSGPSAGQRPGPATWSPTEYACHTRDVLRVFAVRLRDMLTDDDARFADWDGERTAIDDRYWAQRPGDVADELAEAAEEMATVWDTVAGSDWDRTGTRSDDMVFTVTGFARYLLHEVEHHLWDARR